MHRTHYFDPIYLVYYKFLLWICVYINQFSGKKLDFNLHWRNDWINNETRDHGSLDEKYKLLIANQIKINIREFLFELIIGCCIVIDHFNDVTLLDNLRCAKAWLNDNILV